jgi:hypothetical protein
LKRAQFIPHTTEL